MKIGQFPVECYPCYDKIILVTFPRTFLAKHFIESNSTFTLSVQIVEKHKKQQNHIEDSIL